MLALMMFVSLSHVSMNHDAAKDVAYRYSVETKREFEENKKEIENWNSSRKNEGKIIELMSIC